MINLILLYVFLNFSKFCDVLDVEYIFLFMGGKKKK